MAYTRNLILGAGPAGLQLAHCFEQRGEPYLILERADHAGSFFSKYPRHNKLLSINKVYTGYTDRESQRRYDWNSLIVERKDLQFTQYTRKYFPEAETLVEYFGDFAEKLALKIRYETEVTRVEYEGGKYELSLSEGESLSCDRLFVATGLSVEQRPNIEGVDLCESYTEFSVEPDDYIDKRVMIIGKGNSAFETADNLVETTRKIWVVGRDNVRLAWGTHFVGDLRAVNNNFLDTYQLKAQNNILEGEIRSVRKAPDADELIAEVYFESRERSYEFRCDHVLLCTGFRFDDSIYADSCKPELIHHGKLPAMTCEWESTRTENMFFIGALMQSRDFRKTMSAFIHGFRHNIDSLDLMLERRDTGNKHWRRSFRVPDDSAKLAKLAIARLSTSASILLQPGFIVDMIGLREDGATEYLLDVPRDFALERLAPSYSEFMLISLEYKTHDEYMDPFAMPRGRGVEEDYYLHPIITRYVDGAIVDRTFLPDELDNDWRGNAAWQERVCAFVDTQAQAVEPAARKAEVSPLATPAAMELN